MGIVEPVMLEGHVGGSRGGTRWLNPGDLGVLRDTRRVAGEVGPVLAAIARHLQIAVVGTGPNHASLRGRFGDADHGAVVFGGGVLGPDGADALLLLGI